MQACDLLERGSVRDTVFYHPFVVQTVCRRWAILGRRIHLRLVVDAVFRGVDQLDRGLVWVVLLVSEVHFGVVAGTWLRLDIHPVVGVEVLVCHRNHRVEGRWEVVVVAFEEAVPHLVEDTVVVVDVVGVVVLHIDNSGHHNHHLRSHRCSRRRHRVVLAWILVERGDLEEGRRDLVTSPLELDTVDTAQDAPCCSGWELLLWSNSIIIVIIRKE